jgi:hypothetical protein
MTWAEKCSFLVGHGFRVFLHGRGRNVEIERVWLPDPDLD